MLRHAKIALSLLVSALMAFSATSCSNNTSTNTTKKVDTSKHEVITMLTLGDKPTNGRADAALKKANEIINKKVNAELKLQWISWTDWQTQYNLALASGDKSLDLIGSGTDWLDTWPNVKKGSFLELSTDMLKTYAPKTYEQVEKKGDWDKCTYNGSIYFIPEDNYKQYTNHGFFYRTDWAKEAGLTEVKSFKDLQTYFEGILKNHPGVVPWDAVAGTDNTIDGYLQDNTNTQIINGTSTGNYLIFRYDTSDPYKVVCPYYEGQELIDAAKMFKDWNSKHFWREDVLNYNGDTRALFFAGKTGADEHHTETYLGAVRPQMDKQQPGSDVKMFAYGTENKNILKDLATHGACAVGANSQHPERALMVYDLIRFDPDVYKYINYGIEGKDYVVNSDGTRGEPKGYDSNKDGLGIDFWWGRNDDLEIKSDTTYKGWKDVYASYDKISKDYALEKFVFDPSNVSTQMSAVTDVCNTYIPQIQWGKNNDPEGTVAKFREALKDAGIEDIMSEMQTQLDAQKTADGK